MISKNYCCRDCGNLISYNSALKGQGRCYKCASTGKLNSMYKEGQWVNKHYCIDCHKIISYSTWRGLKRCQKCAGKYFSGENRWNYKNGKPKCKDCNKELSSYSSKYCNKCKGKYIKKWRKRNYIGKNNPMYGKSTQSIKVYYKSILFKSTWEANFAKWCDLSGIKWKYEPKTFRYEKYKYTPDFYLSEFDCWIEIKGYWREYSKKKFYIFLKYYPNIFIKVFFQQDLVEKSIIKI